MRDVLYSQGEMLLGEVIEFMALQVIGASFGRTGTHSLAEALEELGFGPCYHMLEINRNPEHVKLWTNALDGKEIDWDRIYQSYHSAVEWPTVSFLGQLIPKYPDAKVVLTHREPEDWYESAKATIFEGLELSQFNPDPSRREQSIFQRRLILEGEFSGKYRDKAYSIKVYEEHIRHVLEIVPAHRLLQYHVKEGWGPLCKFLKVPIPDEPFPRRNERNNFLAGMPDWARKLKEHRDQ